MGGALATIIETENPKKIEYFLLGIGCIGCFVTRYFGVIFLFLTGGVLLYYSFDAFMRQNLSSKKKFKSILLIEIIFSLVIFVFFIINKIKSGMLSGTNRLEFTDDYGELIENLFDAFLAEIYNATSIDLVTLLDDYSVKIKAGVVITIFLFIVIFAVRQYLRDRKFKYSYVFLSMGLFYYVAFIIVRFRSTMDPFGARFFAPASMMISIGLLGLIISKYGKYLEWIKAGIAVILIVLSCGLIQNLSKCSIEDSDYVETKVFYEENTKDIPQGGVIIQQDLKRFVRAFRPDVRQVNYITEDDTIEGLKEGFLDYNGVWIVKKQLLEIIGDEDYDLELRNYLEECYENEGKDKEYIRLF